MDWWQYPLLTLLQQIPAPEPTTVLSFGLSVVILCLISFPSFRKPFLLGTSYQQKALKLHLSMHSSIVFRSSAFHLHWRDIPSKSLPVTFQIQIQIVLSKTCQTQSERTNKHIRLFADKQTNTRGVIPVFTRLQVP